MTDEDLREDVIADVLTSFEDADVDAEGFLDLAHLEGEVVDAYWVEEPYVHVALLGDGEGPPTYHVAEPALDDLGAHLLADLRDHLRDALDVEPAAREAVAAAAESYLPSLPAGTAAALDYYARRDFAGYGPVDPLVRDDAVERVACNSAGRPVYVTHAAHGSVRTSVRFEPGDLAPFVARLARYAGDDVDAERPMLNTRLPSGANAQLTLGEGTAMRGSNFSIRKPATASPVDLVQAGTFDPEMLAYLWLAIEKRKSVMVAGPPGSGRLATNSALATFVPGDARVVTIGKQYDFDLRHENRLDLTTSREPDAATPSSSELLDAAIDHAPDHLLHREIGRHPADGQPFFRAMGALSGCLTTISADSVGEVLKRCITPPMDVSKTQFTALDLVCIQTRTTAPGSDEPIRRNKNLTEINHYDADNDEINVMDVYQWQAETDEFIRMGESTTMEAIMFGEGWSQQRLERELDERRAVLEALVADDVTDPAAVGRAVDRYHRGGLDALERDVTVD